MKASKLKNVYFTLPAQPHGRSAIYGHECAGIGVPAVISAILQAPVTISNIMSGH